MRETITIVGNPLNGTFTSTINVSFRPTKMILRNFALSIPGQTSTPGSRVLLLKCPAITSRNPNLLAFCVDVGYSISGAADDTIDLSYTLKTDTEFQVTSNLQGTVSFSITSIAGNIPTGIIWVESEVAIIMEFTDE